MTERKQLPRAPEKDSLPAKLPKEASRQALSARLRGIKQLTAPQKKKLSKEDWITRHPLLFHLLLVPTSLVLGFGGIEIFSTIVWMYPFNSSVDWSTIAGMHLFNPFKDWVWLTYWILCGLWLSVGFFIAGLNVADG